MVPRFGAHIRLYTLSTKSTVRSGYQAYVVDRSNDTTTWTCTHIHDDPVRAQMCADAHAGRLTRAAR